MNDYPFNRRRVLACLLVVSLVNNLCGATGAVNGITQRRRPQTVLYKLKSSTTPDQLTKLQIVLTHRSHSLEKEYLDGSLKQIHSRNPGGLTEEDLANEIAATGAVEFAEPDYLIAPALVPNDPYYPQQWHHQTMKSAQAWDITTGNGVVVAVGDTGFDVTHPDLSPQLLLPGKNALDGSTNITDVYGHGTATAGTVAGAGNNGAGIAGVVFGGKILPIKITDDTGFAYSSSITAGIQWAADHGARVFNLSFDAGCLSSTEASGQYLRSKGGLLFVAAGNKSTDISSTCQNYPDIILVGSTGPSDTLSGFSNYGTAVDLVAPGESILTTSVGGAYQTWQGTSFSSPIAAGVAALIYSISPTFTPGQVQNFLFSTAVDLGTKGYDPIYGNGRVDAAAAVNAAAASISLNTAPKVAVAAAASPSIVTDVSTNLSVLGSDDAGESNLTYTWSVSGTPPAPVTFSVNGTNAAKNTTVTFTKSGAYKFQVLIQDSKGLSVTDFATANVDQAVTKIVLSPAQVVMFNDGGQNFSAVATDQFGAVISPSPAINWSVSGGGVVNTLGSFLATGAIGTFFSLWADSGAARGTALISIISKSPHPADVDGNMKLDISELTKYSSCWKSGCVWPTAPNPITIDFVTNAGQIWKSGETYHVISGTTLPQSWAPGP